MTQTKVISGKIKDSNWVRWWWDAEHTGINLGVGWCVEATYMLLIYAAVV